MIFRDYSFNFNDEIHDFCSSRYGITFPQYSKIDVNGEIAGRFEPTAAIADVKAKIKEVL